MEINNLKNFIDNNILTITIKSLLNEYNLQKSQFYYDFNLLFNISPKRYINNKRLLLSCYDLIYTKNNILDIAIKFNFQAQETYIRAFKKLFKITPGKFRKTYNIKPKYKGVINNIMQSKNLITNIEKVSFNPKANHAPQNIVYPSVLSKVFNYLDNIKNYPTFNQNKYYLIDPTYVFILGITNLSFSFIKKQDLITPEIDQLLINKPSQIIKKSFMYSNYDYDIVLNEDLDTSLNLIKKSINNNFPIIAYGLYNELDYSYIFGYNENNILGSSFYTKDNLYNESNWFNKIKYFIFIKEKQTPKSININDILLNIKETLLNQENLNYLLGLNALKSWKDNLLNQDLFNDVNDKKLKDLFKSHTILSLNLAEYRYYASLFLNQLSAIYVIYETELNNLSNISKNTHDIIYEMWEILNIDLNNYKRMLDINIRKQLVSKIDKIINNEQLIINKINEMS